MTAEIITIGDEILIGQIVDTNSAFLGKVLNKIGVSVYQITSIQDDKTQILDALQQAENHVDIVIITGGLGPTKDDITKHTLCTYFNDTLVQNDNVLQHIQQLFKQYIKRPMLPSNAQQAMVPTQATVLHNQYGTAPGMWLQKNNTVFISLPGVPFEMKHLINNVVLPRLQQTFKLPFIYHKTLLTYGMGESALADSIANWENNLPKHIKLAYLPSLGRVRLRLSTKGTDKAAIEAEVQHHIDMLLPQIQAIFVGFEDEKSIETLIGNTLLSQNATISLAESCTGGNIAEAFTQHPGASQYFKGGLVAYHTSVKINVLKVSEPLITTHSVVSQQVAEAMAINAQKLFKSTYALSTTGNAGPTKGDADAEIGTVWLALATPKGVLSQKFVFSNQREKTIAKAKNKAFEIILKEISKK